MNKRGAMQIMILWTFYLLLAIYFSYVIISFFSTVSDATLYKQKLQTTQLALGIDVLLMSDYEGTTLRLPKEDFAYYVSTGDVIVTHERGHQDYYAPDKHKRFDLVMDGDSIILRRTS